MKSTCSKLVWDIRHFPIHFTLDGLVKNRNQVQDNEDYEHVARNMEYSAVGILRYPRCDANYTCHTTPSGCCGPWRPTGIRAGAARQECGSANAYDGCHRSSTFRPHSPTGRGISRRFNSGIAGLDRRCRVSWGRSHNYGNQTSGNSGVDYGGKYMGNGSNRCSCRNGARINRRTEHCCSPIRPFCRSMDLPG